MGVGVDLVVVCRSHVGFAGWFCWSCCSAPRSCLRHNSWSSSGFEWS